jgi:3-oxoadipate enol-lactonase
VNFTEVNGTALRYDLDGNGLSTLVLIHEMGGTLESWDLVAPLLSGKRRILRYDTRAGRVALAGIAVGGAIALHVAVRFPQRVAAAVVSSPAIGVAPDRRPVLLARIEKIEREGLQAVIDTLDLSYPLELRDNAQRFAAFRARWLGGDPISYGAIYRMLAGMDLAPELPRITCPVLVIAGTLDRTRPPALVEPVARAISGARYVVLETGHYAPIQTPELYARTVDEFLDAIGM